MWTWLLWQGRIREACIEVVVRDEAGLCIAAFARPILFALSVLQVEAEAVRLG